MQDSEFPQIVYRHCCPHRFCLSFPRDGSWAACPRMAEHEELKTITYCSIHQAGNQTGGLHIFFSWTSQEVGEREAPHFPVEHLLLPPSPFPHTPSGTFQILNPIQVLQGILSHSVPRPFPAPTLICGRKHCWEKAFSAICKPWPLGPGRWQLSILTNVGTNFYFSKGPSWESSFCT